mmetsp:Transcript_78856/g.124515  ORF Transcript_78856/g.124515 Transcript_78856/m.124515 type:complete len:192 (+) Transcript_78856:44-619(+)
MAVRPFEIFDDGSYVFDFTVRKADGMRLGMGVTHCDGDAVLHVHDVRNNGAIASWNKQCANSPAALKVVLPGDKILKVNTATGPDDMLKECRESKLLRITMARGSQTEVAAGLVQPYPSQALEAAVGKEAWIQNAMQTSSTLPLEAVNPVPPIDTATTSAASPPKWSADAWPPSALRAEAFEFVPSAAQLQ